VVVKRRLSFGILVSWTRLVSSSCGGSRLNRFQQALFPLLQLCILLGPFGSRVQVQLFYHSHQISVFSASATLLVFLSRDY
jgi:hypothetical protein